MLIKMCAKEKIELINIVRNEKYIENLMQIGAKYVISTSNKGWEKELTELSEKLQANILFDCVGGDWTVKFLKCIPDNSILYHYGNLELKKINGLESSELLFKNKTIKGWWLDPWMKSLKIGELKKWKDYVIDDFKSNSGIFFTHYTKVYPLSQIYHALDYYMANMSEGKVILKPHF